MFMYSSSGAIFSIVELLQMMSFIFTFIVNMQQDVD